MKWLTWAGIVGAIVLSTAAVAQAEQGGVSAKQKTVVTPAGLESVRGKGCYIYGDDDTPAKARRSAMALARQQAVENYQVYVQSVSTVKNFQLENEIVQNMSAGLLQDVQVEKTEKKDQEICIFITAKISPVKLDELIQQQTKAKETAQAAQAPLLAAGSQFGLRLWLNKSDGRYAEGEPLIISVQSDRDGYLKLDYYQADRTVVHLVPNIYGGEAFIRAGQTYTFGGPGGRETFTIQGPFGTEAIKALVSSQPFDSALAASRNVDDSRAYLKTIQTATRGIRVDGASGSGQAQWAESAVGLVTTSKVVADYNAGYAGVRGLRKLSSPSPPEPAKPISTTGSVGNRPEESLPRP